MRDDNSDLMKATLFIRADASEQIGTGHVMRMLALAQAYQDRGGPVTIACAACPEGIAERIRREGIGLESMKGREPGSTSDLQQSIARAESLGAKWVVLDGYHFDVTYQRALRAAGFRVLAVDDYGHCDIWAADAVLNQNIFAPEFHYRSGVKGCRFLLGTRFALLRREFREEVDCQSRSSGRESAPSSHDKSQSLLTSAPAIQGNPIRRLLITLGGVDAGNTTGRLLESLNRLPEPRLEIKLLVGAGNPHGNALRSLAATSPHAVELLRNVQDMPSSYRWAEGVISAGGSTCWEWMFYRLPAAVVCLADNQRPVIAGLVKHRLALDLGWHSDLELDSTAAKLHAWLDRNGAHAFNLPQDLAVDGLGAERVVSVLDDLNVWLRRARSEDARLWFGWANDPVVRANGFHPEPIPWETHSQWFEHHRQSPDSRLWIGFDLDEKPLGYVRLHHRDSGEWEIGVAVDATFRNRGCGLRLVTLALQKFSRESALTAPDIMARIKPANTASLKLFQTAGFQPDAARTDSGSCVLVRKLINYT